MTNISLMEKKGQSLTLHYSLTFLCQTPLVFNLRKQIARESSHVIFDESSAVIDSPLRLIGYDIFNKLEYHHIYTGSQNVSTFLSVEPATQVVLPIFSTFQQT